MASERPYSRPEALKADERARQLCLATKALMDRTRQLVEASHGLQQVCRELLRDAEMLTARVNHGAATRSAKQPPEKR